MSRGVTSGLIHPIGWMDGARRVVLAHAMSGRCNALRLGGQETGATATGVRACESRPCTTYPAPIGRQSVAAVGGDREPGADRGDGGAELGRGGEGEVDRGQVLVGFDAEDDLVARGLGRLLAHDDDGAVGVRREPATWSSSPAAVSCMVLTEPAGSTMLVPWGWFRACTRCSGVPPRSVAVRAAHSAARAALTDESTPTTMRRLRVLFVVIGSSPMVYAASGASARRPCLSVRLVLHW